MPGSKKKNYTHLPHCTLVSAFLDYSMFRIELNFSSHTPSHTCLVCVKYIMCWLDVCRWYFRLFFLKAVGKSWAAQSFVGEKKFAFQVCILYSRYKRPSWENYFTCKCALFNDNSIEEFLFGRCKNDLLKSYVAWCWSCNMESKWFHCLLVDHCLVTGTWSLIIKYCVMILVMLSGHEPSALAAS